MKTKTEDTSESIEPGPETGPESVDTQSFDRLEAENVALKEAIRVIGAREQITNTLREAGARSPKLLFDAVRDDLQFADDGTLANGEAILKRLMKRFPEQFGSDLVHESIDGGAGRVAAPALTKEALGKMTPAEIAKLDWAAVKRVLSDR